MKAVCWFGKHDVRVETVDDPHVLNPRDAVVKITSTAICGSDLHIYDGFIPTMKSGDILGHEFMGEVVELGSQVKNIKIGQRVVVPFTISCGHCFFCEKELWSLCDNSNPNAGAEKRIYGAATSGLFGYSHLFGGYAGGQAEYARVPYADVGLMPVPDAIPDESALLLSDVFPTAYMAAENCDIRPGDIVAIWGCGPVGQLAIRCALWLGADRVIAIDENEERLQMAIDHGNVIGLKAAADIPEKLRELTGGMGPDACIDAVGMEAHGISVDALYDEAKTVVKLQTDRPHVLRQAIQACRKGGILSIPGVYGGVVDKFPIGTAFAKGLTFKMGQTHVQKYMKPLMELILEDELDPSFIITHRLHLSEAPKGYQAFGERRDHCLKVVMKP